MRQNGWPGPGRAVLPHVASLDQGEEGRGRSLSNYNFTSENHLSSLILPVQMNPLYPECRNKKVLAIITKNINVFKQVSHVKFNSCSTKRTIKAIL